MGTIATLAAYLEAANLGVVGQSIFAGMIPGGGAAIPPADPFLALLAYDNGRAPEHTHDLAPVSLELPGVQVRALSPTRSLAEGLAVQAWPVLDLTNTTLGGVRYLRVRPLQSPFPVGQDEYGRWMVGWNLDVSKQPG